jgi:hypothetical protein
MSAELSHQPTSTTLAAAPSFAVPFDQVTEFAGLPEARRNEIHYTLRILERLHVRIGEIGKMAALAEITATHQHAMRGLSVPSLNRKYTAYLAGGWRALVKGYKAPSKQPDQFVQEVRRRAELNHRSMSEAFQQLRDEWAAGASIPGYGTWVDYYMRKFPERPMPKVWPRGFFPAGWSIDNLLRYAPAKGARVLAQRGIAAAKKHFPSLKRDPSQLRPLELITIDDFELDALCVFPGDQARGLKPQIGRMAGLLAICVATRKKLVWGIGQRLEREEPQADGTIRTVRTGIARVDVQLLLHQLFERFGLPDYQVTLLVENASAAIAPELQLCLETLFEGRVKIERTGLIDHKTLTNGFTERGGKPWEKGWIESTFNQLWNTLGAMKGYKGSNQRLNAPASLDDALRYTKLLIGQGERALNLPPEAIAKLRLPFMSPAEAEEAFAWAISVNETRDNHNYIGFTRVTEFLLADGSAPVGFADLALLPPEAQQAVVPVERMETVAERWSTQLAHVTLTPIPAPVLALLLLTPKRVAYRNHSITFVHAKQGFTYVDASGKILAGLSDGTEFLAYFDAAHPQHLQLAGMDGRYVGQLTRLGGARGAIDIRDKAALKEAAALQAEIINRTIGEVKDRHADQRAEAIADREFNAQVVAAHQIDTAGLSAAERIGLAAGQAAQATAEKQATDKALARAVQARAAKISDQAINDFLSTDEKPAAPSTNEAVQGDSLADYL